jgi:uncharacterized protein YecE (DUF72 family)
VQVVTGYLLLHSEGKPVSASQAIQIGCCGFAGSQKEYAKSFRVVEVQQTFYEPPQLSTAQRWRAEAPQDFEFSMKAWQLITHESTSPTYRRLRTVLNDGARMCVGSFKPTKDVWKAWLRTKEIAASLRARIVVFQCPASFEPSERNKANLRRFFAAAREDIERLGQEIHFGWEPRGEWQKRDIGILCKDLNLLHVVDPFRHESVTSGEFYYRLHGTANYRHRYTDEELMHLKELTASRGPGYCMFNNISMKEDALRFAGLMTARV